MRPGSDGFTVYALWALAAIVFIVARDLATRRLTPDAPGTAVAFVTSLALTVAAGLAAVATDWAPVGPRHLLALAVAALCLIVGYIFGVTVDAGRARSVSCSRSATRCSSGRCSSASSCSASGPTRWMLVGSAIVVGTGLFTLYRERRLGLAAAPRARRGDRGPVVMAVNR